MAAKLVGMQQSLVSLERLFPFAARIHVLYFESLILLKEIVPFCLCQSDISTLFLKQVLVDVPDYSERCQYLEMLKNRLEATLSPQIVGAFNTQSLGKGEIHFAHSFSRYLQGLCIVKRNTSL